MNIHIKKENGLPPASLDDVQSDVNHLSVLLNVTLNKLHDTDFVRDGKRDTELDEVAALLWIARDRAEFIAEFIRANYSVIRGWEKGEAQ